MFYVLYYLALWASLCLVALFYAHMFQLEAYIPRSFFRWLNKRLFRKRVLLVTPSIVSAVIITVWGAGAWTLSIGALCHALTAFVFRPRKAKKPFVATARMKRLFFSVGLVCCLVCIITALVGYVGLASLLMPLLPYLILLCNAVNRPIEKSVCNHYIKQAKRIIEARKGSLTVIGITGSYGKTSTKFFLNKILSQKYNVLMTPSSYNTTMGVVRVMREMLKPSHEIFICEMGARCLGEIKEICDIVLPAHGIITSIGPQHLETFKSIDTIVRTKFELADAVGDKGHMICNGDNRYIYDRRYSDSYIYYGMENERVGYFAMNVTASADGSSFDLRFPDGETLAFTTRLIGKHNVLNILACVAMADAFGVSRGDIVRAVKRLEPVPHRLQLFDGGDVTIIDDSFNSNPSGSRSALEALSEFNGVRVIVTPGMVELGDSQSILNYQLGEQAADFCQYIYIVGNVNYDSIYKGAISTGFDPNRIIRVQSPAQAIASVRSLPTDYKKIILLENDLPDNFQ